MNQSKTFRQEQTAEQLAQRIQNLSGQKNTQSYEDDKPVYGKIRMPLQSDQEVTERLMVSIDNNPMTRATADEKFAIIQKEYQEALKLDLKARKARSEAIEKQVVNHLKSMNIEPDYVYSKEIVYEEEGEDN